MNVDERFVDGWMGEQFFPLLAVPYEWYSGLIWAHRCKVNWLVWYGYDDLGAIMVEMLVLCTGNVCRSPMAQALIECRLSELGVKGIVRSAGILRSGESPPPQVISVMRNYGLDVSSHRSRMVSGADLQTADLVLGMAREHVRHAVVMAPEAWPRTFSLKEIVRRGERTGPRISGESIADWLARVREGRQRAALVGSSLVDDIADPMGYPPSAYDAAAALIDQAVKRLVELCWLSADSVLSES